MSASRWSSLLFAVLALSTAAHAQTTYRLSRIDAGVDVRIFDVNENGEVVGEAFAVPDAPPRPFLLRDGMLIDLGDLCPEPAFRATAINDLTQIVGVFSSAPLGGGGFFWESGQIRDLAVDAFGTGPRDINNRGQVVGFSSRGAFLWEQGRTTFLEQFGGPPSPVNGFGVASAINENGVIVGTSPFRSPEFLNPVSRVVIWQNGELMALEPPFPMDFGEGRDVNDRNEAIGFYIKACCTDPILPGHCCTSPTPGHVAFLWQSEGEVIVLPVLDRSPDPQRVVALRSFPNSINDAGQIVGFTTLLNMDTDEEVALGCCGGGSLTLATLWRDGAVFDLNELVRDDDPAKPFVRLLAGIKITDSGVILASAVDSRDAESPFRDYFLLTPDGTFAATAPPSSPSPSASDSGGGAVDVLSLLLLILGLSSFARSQRMHRVSPFD